jgi:hypothetical protein
MNFQNDMVLRVYETRKGAERFIGKHYANDARVHIQIIDNRFFIIR